jgi:hypothetical protein
LEGEQFLAKEKSYSPNERTKAKNRAKKFEVLFNEKTFDAIMNAVESKPQNRPAFDKAVLAAGLQQEEANWLWGYLQHSDEKLWLPVPEAAGTGW